MIFASVELCILWTSSWTSSWQTSVSQIQRNTHTCCQWGLVSSAALWSGMFNFLPTSATHSCCKTQPGRRPHKINKDRTKSVGMLCVKYSWYVQCEIQGFVRSSQSYEMYGHVWSVQLCMKWMVMYGNCCHEWNKKMGCSVRYGSDASLQLYARGHIYSVKIIIFGRQSHQSN